MREHTYKQGRVGKAKSSYLDHRKAFLPYTVNTNPPAKVLTGHDFCKGQLYNKVAVKPIAKLTINRPGDIYEQEADRVAEQVMHMPESSVLSVMGENNLIGLLAANENGSLKTERNDIKQKEQPTLANKSSLPNGQPLDSGIRDFMEQRFYHDFSGVRVHANTEAAESALSVNALAYTVGQDIVFGTGQYQPGTFEGKKLLAHELTHVLQQRSERVEPSLQRQDIPLELQTSVDLTILSDEELRERYDLITATLALFTETTTETNLLEQEAGNVGIELGRREALAEGRTFSEESIVRMRDYFKQNAKKTTPDSCIVCLNKGVKLLLNNPNQKTTPESIEKTMGVLQTSGRAGTVRVIEFEDKKGRITTGTLYPDKLHESAWDAVIQIAGGDPGWSVFGLSLMDGNHSITLTLDNNIPSQPVIYWSDQWSSKGGWKQYDKAGLDGEITRLTQSWWKDQPEDRKFNTRMRLWRLNQ